MNFRFNREVTKKTTVMLFLILMAGLLIYWIGYFVTDSFFETGGVMREDQWQEAAAGRMKFHQYIGIIQNVCAIIFMAGLIVLFPSFRKMMPLPLKRLAMYFLGMELIVFAGAGIFAVIDREAAGDYFFPAWGISLYLAVFFVVIVFWNLLRMKKYS